MNIPAWRAALRIARREAWRAKGRSLLILLMVMLPVFAASAAVITFRSQQLDPGERLARVLGRADALVWDAGAGGRAVYQDNKDGDNRFSPSPADGSLPPGTVVGLGGVVVPGPTLVPPDVPATIPAGSTVLPHSVAALPMRTKHGLTNATVNEFDYSSPLAHGIVRQLDGRAPRTSDEVALTSKMLRTGGLKIGDRLVQPDSGKSLLIVGAVELPDHLRAEEAFALPGAVIDRAQAQGAETWKETRYLVDAPPGAYRWDQVRKLNEKGIVATSREAALQKLPDSEVPYRTDTHNPALAISDLALAVTVVVIGMALLEVVLLAGPAFAVGARRRRRELGLVGVAGGDRAHIRAIVLADGIVIGVAAGLLGTALGSTAAWFSRDWFAEMSGKRLGHYDVRPLELLGVAGLGLLIGVIAALVPALLAARESVVDSLSGRRGVRHGSKILPLAGVVIGAAGLGLAYYGVRVRPNDSLLLTGCVLAELGIIACCPILLGAAGRLGRFLPLTPRLALRDAARNRPRTAPAVAAVMAAIAGAISVTTYWAGTDHDARELYNARAQEGQVAVQLYGKNPDVGAITRAVAEALPVTGDGTLRGFPQYCPQSGDGCVHVEPVIPEPNQCPLARIHSVDPFGAMPLEPPRPTSEQIAAARKDPRCVEIGYDLGGFGTLVGDGETARRVTGSGDPRIAEALKHGAVVFDKRFIHDGKITLAVSVNTSADNANPQESPPPEPRKITVPAVHVELPGDHLLTVMLGEEAARGLGVPITVTQLLYDTKRMPTEAEEQRGLSAVSALTQGHLYVERGYEGRPSTELLLLAGATIIVALGAAGVATGLALADSRRDLATLGAVGAPPRVRRSLSAAQSWVVAVIGTALGVVVGLLPAAALRWKTAELEKQYRENALEFGNFFNIPPPRGFPVVIPWTQMGLALLVIPLLAAAVAAVFTRSREVLRPRGG